MKLQRAGVAVAQLRIDEEGTVRRVEILEAPSDAIAKSMTGAISRWRFVRNIAGAGLEVTGKITYYFVISNGTGTVLEPKDAPYVGHQALKESVLFVKTARKEED